jgi:hypothetical protein
MKTSIRVKVLLWFIKLSYLPDPNKISFIKCKNYVRNFKNFVTVFRQKTPIFDTSLNIIKMKNQINMVPAGITASKANRFNSMGYPSYPAIDDIYHKFHKEKDIDPEDISKNKAINENDKIKAFYDKYLLDEMCGNYLDVPGAEMDDEQENIGNEDEENNYYSIGGDEHNDLDEYKIG